MPVSFTQRENIIICNFHTAGFLCTLQGLLYLFGICQLLHSLIRQSNFPNIGRISEGCISIQNLEDYSPFPGTCAQRYHLLNPSPCHGSPSLKLKYLISSCNNTISKTRVFNMIFMLKEEIQESPSLQVCEM